MELISIVIVTKRNNINKIIDNYKRQIYINKELIIIINNENIDKNFFIKKLNENNINYKIYQNNNNVTLGECYNYSINILNGKYFCKMDDDDYYDEKYIINQLYLLKKYNCDIIGKSYFYLYDSYNNILYSKFINNIILGGTMIIKKNVFDKIKFDNLNRGEDTNFLKKASKNKFKIYSSSIDDFVYIRYTNDIDHHTYNVNIKTILGKNYKIINNTNLKIKLKNFININN